VVRIGVGFVSGNRTRDFLPRCFCSSSSSSASKPTHVPQTLGSLTHIGDHCVIEAAYIGSGVVIGSQCKIVSGDGGGGNLRVW